MQLYTQGSGFVIQSAELHKQAKKKKKPDTTNLVIEDSLEMGSTEEQFRMARS